MTASSAALIDAFCDQVWLQNGLAAASLASYRRDLTQWAAWLEAHGTALLAANRADVEAYLADQYRAKAKATSIARRLSSLRRFYGLQMQQAALRADPTAAHPRAEAPPAAPEEPYRSPGRGAARRTRCANDAGTARSGDAGNALCDGTPRVRADRPHARAGVARHGRRARARQGQQGTARAPRRRSDRLAQALSRLVARDPRGERQQGTVRHRAARPPDPAGVLGAAQALRGQGRHPRHERCRRTCCGTRSRHTSSTTAPTCASCNSCSGTPTSRRRRSTRTSPASG